MWAFSLPINFGLRGGGKKPLPALSLKKERA